MANGSPFIEPGGEGPGFDPDQAAAGAERVREDAAAEEREAGIGAYGVPEVEEEKVRGVLGNAGDGLHAAFGVGEYDWLMTQRDLDRIAPPLTRIINRYEMAKVVAGYSDEAALAIGVGLWSWRSVLERVAVLREAERRGVPSGAPPSSGPTPAPAPPREAPPPPAWPTAAPAPPQASPAPQPSPQPGASPPRAGVGGDHFPGAGAPRERAEPVPVEVAPGYVTQAERIRQARERTPVAVPAEAPPASQ